MPADLPPISTIAGIALSAQECNIFFPVAREEIFGPVLSVLEYEDQDEAINIANDTDFGLGAGVFTKDLKKASWTANKLESGQVYVNKWFAGNHATPFGGYKQSGYSREKGVDALKSYLQVKNVGISLD